MKKTTKFIMLFTVFLILAFTLVIIGLASEMPVPTHREGTVCESDECAFKAPEYIPEEIKQKIMEVIK